MAHHLVQASLRTCQALGVWVLRATASGLDHPSEGVPSPVACSGLASGGRRALAPLLSPSLDGS